MQLTNIGFGNTIASDRIVAIVGPDSAPIKRMIQDSKDLKRLVDATFGKKTKSVIIMDSGHIILSSLTPKLISQRCCDCDENDSKIILKDGEEND